MNLFVPRIGTIITLVAPWQFDLYNEERNATLMTHLGDTRATKSRWALYDDTDIAAQVLPVGTRLKIDRIYIRKGKDLELFNSMTFTLPDVRVDQPMFDWGGKPTGKTRKSVVRFWVKLDDANRIEFNPATIVLPE